VKLVVRFASPLTSSYTARLVRLGLLVAPVLESFAALASEEEAQVSCVGCDEQICGATKSNTICVGSPLYFSIFLSVIFRSNLSLEEPPVHAFGSRSMYRSGNKDGSSFSVAQRSLQDLKTQKSDNRELQLFA
jgi:hypothetical protein